MVPKKLFLTSIILAPILIFCQCFVFHLASIEDQTHKGSKEYNHYLTNLNYDTLYSYQLKPSYFDSLKTSKYGLNTYKIEHNSQGFSVTQIRCYDSTGSLISGFEQCFGEIKKQPALLDTFPMRKLDYLPVNYSLTLENDLKWINIPNEELPFILKQSKSSTCTIIIGYSIWAGWYNDHILKVYHNYLVQNSNEDYFLILVNFDI